MKHQRKISTHMSKPKQENGRHAWRSCREESIRTSEFHQSMFRCEFQWIENTLKGQLMDKFRHGNASFLCFLSRFLFPFVNGSRRVQSQDIRWRLSLCSENDHCRALSTSARRGSIKLFFISGDDRNSRSFCSVSDWQVAIWSESWCVLMDQWRFGRQWRGSSSDRLESDEKRVLNDEKPFSRCRWWHFQTNKKSCFLCACSVPSVFSLPLSLVVALSLSWQMPDWWRMIFFSFFFSFFSDIYI